MTITEKRDKARYTLGPQINYWSDDKIERLFEYTEKEKKEVASTQINQPLNQSLQQQPVTGLAVGAIRTFPTGANRSADAGKPDYEGFLSPLVLHKFGEYMSKHRVLPNGELRASDNWTNGIPRKQYLKSLLRHVMDVWALLRGWPTISSEQDLSEALCAVMFNTMGLLHEVQLGREVQQ